MKKFTFIFAGLALLASAAFTSCEKTPAPSADEGTKSIALSINFGGVATKAVDEDLEAGFVAGDNYTSLQIYFTDDAGNIKYAYNATENNANDGTAAGEIWDNLASAANSKGVKFIGLDAVSGVYVTANAPLSSGIITYGGAVSKPVAVSAINELLKIENIDATEANAMPYAGACIQLQPLGSTQISADAGEVVVGDGADGAEYWKAELSIRPVVSRFEVSKVGVKTSGTTYFKEVDNEGVKVLEPCDDTDPNVKYKVEWNGFDADLIGIYMSNFYKSSPLFPNKTEIKDWTAVLFATPGFAEGVSPIAEGKWTGLSDDQKGISYADYNNGYQDFTTAHAGTTSGTTNYLFDGGSDASAVVVPFNFFVPYSLTDRSATADDVANLGAACPALHFQFKKPENPTINYTSVQYKTSDNWQAVADNNLKQQLQNAVAWPNSTDGIAYANVTKFLNQDKLTELTVKPGLIYKVQEVVVEPVNLSVSTKDTDQFNVYVVVKVVGFDERNVYPVFD
ncbi:MAG: hypothetical protein IAB76_00740 [Bacteroidetes bacterium]|uniref:Major fimbrial subunit protein N-terminal domain-containing protein n=1 Tax=Candidatus Cryptobacteroides avistercoris TaxID=2840758 RepID=A0A9D9NN56_9BACT|nr:hypothetical protein [Candidatus Cryptobacteroides avistercoris]